MLDDCPDEQDEIDLSIPNHHSIWTFRRHKDDASLLTVRVEEDQVVRQLAIHLNYCPALACFDLEYWTVMGKGAPIPIEKNQLQLRKYFHRLRREIMEEIFSAQGEYIRLGTKDIAALHTWSNRMWFNCRQPPHGRRKYEIWCRLYNKEPYPSRLTATHWKKFFEKYADRYRSVTTNADIQHNMPCGPEAELLDAQGLLINLGMIPEREIRSAQVQKEMPPISVSTAKRTKNTRSPSITQPSSAVRRLPPPPRTNDSSHGLSDSQVNNTPAHLRSFEHHIPLKHDIKYTYTVNSSSPNKVYFFEYHGYGVPSPTLGALGDLYMDLTPDSYMLYAKVGTDWIHWNVPSELEHPFLTDTILSLSIEGVTWTHPSMVDKYSKDADVHHVINDMFNHADKSLRTIQPPRKRTMTDRRDDSDALAAGDNPRKRRKVDKESFLTTRNLDFSAASLPEHPLLGRMHSMEEEPRSVDSAPIEIAVISLTDHTPFDRPDSKDMESGTGGLQGETAKLQEDLRGLQAQNSQVTLRNEELQQEILKNTNEELRGKTNEREDTEIRTVELARTPDVSSAGARNQPSYDDGVSTCTEPRNKNLLGSFSQLLNHGSNMDLQKSEFLPADIRNQVAEHANNLISIMDGVIDTHLRLQTAEKTIADQKLSIATLSVEVHKQQDARVRMETELRRKDEQLSAISEWLMSMPKY